MSKLTLRAVALLSALLLPAMTQSEDKDKAPAAEAAAKSKGAKPESLNEKVSYAYGLMIARQLTERGTKLDLKQFNKAFKGFVAGEEPLLNEDEMGDAFAENQRIVDEANRAQQRIDDEKNATGEGKVQLEAGKKFLEENGKKKGISTTKSGLQYEVMKKGDGEKPKATDQVTVHYHGTLTDGTVFDSSVDRGEPATFGLNQVIPGWTEGVQLMPKGSKYRFFIPYDLAYGSRGSGATIKPYSTLIFEVEYLDIKK